MHSTSMIGKESNEILATDEFPSPHELAGDGYPWYAVRLFSLRLNEALNYFSGAGLTCFVPMECSEQKTIDNDGNPCLSPWCLTSYLLRKARKNQH